MGRSGFNAPVFSDSADKSKRRTIGDSGTACTCLVDTWTRVRRNKNIYARETTVRLRENTFSKTDLLDEFECYLQTQLYIRTMQTRSNIC